MWVEGFTQYHGERPSPIYRQALMIAVPLAQLREELDYQFYLKVAKTLGGAKRAGPEALVPILAVLDTVGTHEAMRSLSRAQQPSATQARFFAAQLAFVVSHAFHRRMYEFGGPEAATRFAAPEAIREARNFAAGKIPKSQLAHAHAGVLAAEKAAHQFGLETSAVFAARAAAACSAPFCSPGQMIWDAYHNSWRASSMGEGHFAASAVALEMLEAAQRAYSKLKNADWTDEERGAAGIILVAVREAGFKKLEHIEARINNFDDWAGAELRKYLAGNYGEEYETQNNNKPTDPRGAA